MFESDPTFGLEVGLGTEIRGVIDGATLIVEKRSIHRLVSGFDDCIGFGVDYSQGGFVFAFIVSPVVVYFYSRFEILPG